MERRKPDIKEIEMISNEAEFSSDNQFVDRFNHLRKINKFTDCSFKVENRVLSAHKLILCAASPVFEAMMYSKFSEGSDYLLDASNSIRITDISYETFDAFLSYIYTGELRVKDEAEDIRKLLELGYCAQKYMIEDMRKQCLKKLNQILTQDTCLKFFGKSFEMHLEDFIVSCLYYIADSVEAGKSFTNHIMNSEDSHLSTVCFEFLVKNLLDYLGDHDDVLCLAKSWSFVECHVQGLTVNHDSLTTIISKLNLDKRTSEKIVQLKSAFVEPNSSRISRNFHRVYYKPVRPLIIEKNQLSFDTNITFKRFTVIKSLMVNSRLIPEAYDICDMSNQTYTECVNVEILEKSSGKSIHHQNHTISNVSFNSFFRITLDDSLLLFPHHAYVIKFTWNDDSIGFEYPRCIFSLLEKGSEIKTDDKKYPLSIVQFHEYDYYYNSPFGSIIQGIFYDLVS